CGWDDVVHERLRAPYEAAPGTCQLPGEQRILPAAEPESRIEAQTHRPHSAQVQQQVVRRGPPQDGPGPGSGAKGFEIGAARGDPSVFGPVEDCAHRAAHRISPMLAVRVDEVEE